jgi:hypothetical protein
MRVIASVEVAGGTLITLSDRTTKTLKLLGQTKSAGVPMYRSSAVKRYVEVAPGVDVMADHLVLAIYLTSAKAPPVYVQASGQGAKKQPLKVGMSLREVMDIVKDQPTERRHIDDPKVQYVFLPTLGVGIRFADDRVTEIVLAQVPRKRGF